VGKRRPADGYDDGVFFGVPAVANALAPRGVVAGVFEGVAGGVQGDVEPAGDQDDDGGAVLGVLPGVVLFTGAVDAPFDLDVGAVGKVVGVDEMADDPAVLRGLFDGGTAEAPAGLVGGHQVTSMSGRFVFCGHWAATKRSPSRRASSPSSLHRGSPISLVRPSVSQVEQVRIRSISQLPFRLPAYWAHQAASSMTARQATS